MYSNGPGGEHSMSVAGEGRLPGKSDVVLLGKKMGLLPGIINEIIEQTMNAVVK
jgi:serine/threonine-protein kinase HipA